MSIFPGATNVMITGGTFTAQQLQGSRGGFHQLQQCVAHGAFHDSGERFDPPKCHPNTRVAVIKRIMDWISGLNEKTQKALVMWLYGAAGAGKSAIAQTIAEILDGQGFVLASFFFSRNDPQRGTAKLLVTTLAYQLATKLPQMFREGVARVFEHDPLISTRSLEAQLKALIREPLLELLYSGFSPAHHIVVIIDGLDECNDPNVQAKIVDLAFSVLAGHDIPLRILIASRSEMAISDSFEKKTSFMLARAALDNDYQSSDDIRQYLSDKFYEIKTRHRLRTYTPDIWPSVESLDILINKSSGQFIYASTVVKYVKSPRHRPSDRLEIVLGIHPPKACDGPFAELDALYRHILMGVDDIDLVLKIIWFLVFRPPQYCHTSPSFLDAFFSLTPGDVQISLQSIGSLLSISDEHAPYDEGRVPCIRVLHASLKDYLFDQSRSQDFFREPFRMHTHFAELSITHLIQLASLPSCSPFRFMHDAYLSTSSLFQYFFHHCPRSESTPLLLEHILNIPLSRCHHILGVHGRYETWLSHDYLHFLKALGEIWAVPIISQFCEAEMVAFAQLITSRLDPRIQNIYVCFFLALVMAVDTPPRLFSEYIFTSRVLTSPGRIIQLGGTIHFLTSRVPLLCDYIHTTLQDSLMTSQNLIDMPMVYANAAISVLRYISTYKFAYSDEKKTTRFGRSCRYLRTRTYNPAQPLWYRRSSNTLCKMYFRNRNFRDFIDLVAKGVFVDQKLHPNKWYLRNMDNSLRPYILAIEMLPPFLKQAGYSEDLIAHTRHARISGSLYYLNIAYPMGGIISHAEAAIRTYLKRVENVYI